MHRRRLLEILNAVGASFVLPAPAFYREGASVLTPTIPQDFKNPANAFEKSKSNQDIPKIGVVVIGRFGGDVLSKLAVRLPYLSRSIAVNTDGKFLYRTNADRKIRLGDDKAPPPNPHAARVLAQSSILEIADAVAGLDMVFLVAEMGGATSTDIAPMVAQMLREQNILTLAFVASPFDFGSKQRKHHAQTGIQEVRLQVNALLPFSIHDHAQVTGQNDLHPSASSQAALAFNQLWCSILNPICSHGWVDMDFEDLNYLLLNHEGDSAFGFGSASGVNGAANAARLAISHPLLGQRRLKQASAIFITVTASPGVLMLGDMASAMRSIRKQLFQDPRILFGTYYEPSFDNEVTISILACGIRNAEAYATTQATGWALD